MKANKGFTLLEVAVVLAVIAILAAILTPIVTSYIDQARVTRAQNDVKKIAEAVNLFKRDTGTYPGYNLASDAASGGSVSGFSTGLSGCLVSGPSGLTTTLNSGNVTNLGAWTCTNAGLLETYLNLNSLGFTANDSAVGGKTSFRGPYLDGLSGTDPWGNRYVVNSANLASASSAWAFAISSGPNGVIDTAQAPARTAVLTASSDDILSLIH